MVRRGLLAVLAAALVAGCCDPEIDATCYDASPPKPCQDRACGDRCYECSEGVPPWACTGPDLHCTQGGLCVSGSILCQ